MAIHQRMVMMILAFTCQCAYTQGVSIQNCNKTKVVELNQDDMNLNKTFTCKGIRKNAQVKWQLTGKRLHEIACPPFNGTFQSCDTSSSNLYGNVFPKRTSKMRSTMTIHVGSVQKTLENATIVCKVDETTQAECPLDWIRPAKGTCHASLDTESPREWSVHVRCNITRGKSTRGRYRCLLSQESPAKKREVEVNMINTDRLRQNGTAACDHRFGVNTTDTGRHRYSVQLIPGRTNVTVLGDIAIERPEKPPIIECQPNLDGGGMVPENKNLTCQCRTQSLGKPQGALKWSRKEDKTDKFVVLKEGKEGQSNLPFRATLTRHNHTTWLRCGVQWGKEFIQNSIEVKITVGYPASRVVLDINSGNPVVAEKSNANFKCWATDGRPSPTLTLRGRGSGADLSQTGPANLTYAWSNVRCEDSGSYTCTARNDMGPNKTVTSVLNVTYSTTSLPRRGHPLHFDLVANPPPFKVTFLFLGSLEANSTSEIKDIVLSGRCEQKGGVRARCNVTLSNVTSSEVAGLYRGSVTNGHGSLDFLFEVKLNATMTEGPESSSLDVVLVAAVAGGGVAVLVVIIIIFVVIVRRHARKGSNRISTHRSRYGDHTYGDINVLNPMPGSGAQNNAGSLAPESADTGHEVNADGLLYVSMDFSNHQAAAFRPPPPHAEGDVLYSGVNFSSTTPADAGHEVNADGLLYVSMDFSNHQASTFSSAPPPAEGEVLYGAVDFSRTAPAQ